MKHLFIINPAAGSHNQTEAYRKKIAQVCEPKGLDYAIEISAAPGCCHKIARKAAESGEEYRIYACGGDGTLNEIVNGVAGFDNVAVTAFSGGSGNDFTKVFNEPEAFKDLERLLDCEEQAFDLIDCNGDYSLNICSVGLDARIAADVSNYKRLPLLHGFAAYAASAAVNVVKGISDHYVIEVDGQRLDEEQTLICVCNGRFYGGGFNPVPEADPADGILEVLIIQKVSRLKVAQVIGKYKDGRFKELLDIVRYFRTDSLRILCDTPSVINLDGEMRVSKTMEMKVADKKLRFFYPKGLTWKKK